MKEIVYAVYHDLNKEARSMEVLNGLKKCGNVHLITYAIPKDSADLDLHLINKKSPFALFHFLSSAKQVIKRVNPDWVVLHDNDCSALIPFIKKHSAKSKIIYDSSELFIKPFGEYKKIFPKEKFLGNDGIKVFLKCKLSAFRNRYEHKYLKNADVVIAANRERAEIMKEYFSLSNMPLIFDNMHKIEDIPDTETCEKRFKGVINKDRFNILFAGGISEERKTLDYVEAIKKSGDNYNLIIAGSASETALKRYEKAVKSDKDHIFYVGFLDRATLRFLMKKCDASVVIFDCNSYNTMFCASGKCYESLFEGTPILVSENPPLKYLCEKYNVGVSDNDYCNAVKTLEKNYGFYKNCLNEYVSSIHYETRIDKLICEINDLLKNS